MNTFYRNRFSKNEFRLVTQFHEYVLSQIRERHKLELNDYKPYYSQVALESSKNKFDKDYLAKNWKQESLNRQLSQFNFDNNSKLLGTLNHKLYIQKKSTYDSALNLLKSSWPNAYRFYTKTIQEVVWFEAENFWSSSDPSCFGCLFLNPTSEWCELNFFETIIHEMSHHSLMLVDAFEPLLVNPNVLVSSPLRKDLRPLKGVMHAVFVLIRMVHGLNCLVKHLPKEVHKKAIFMKSINEKRLKNGIKTLEENAKWTNVGFKFAADLKILKSN